MNQFVIPSLDIPNAPPCSIELKNAIAAVNSSKRYMNTTDPRMIPSIQNKEKPIQFRP